MDKEVKQLLIACIVSRKGGIPLDEINEDFKSLVGLKDLYFVKDENNNDFLIADTVKSRHMAKLVEKQKPPKRKRDLLDHSSELNYSSYSHASSSQNSDVNPAKKRKAAILNMEYLTPVMYGYQLMGDDVLLKVAENHLMVNVSKTAPKRCGLCIAGQTILDLLDNIHLQSVLPYRVAILIGLVDLLNEKTAEEMIYDMDLLITGLKSRNIKATLFTIPFLSCIPKRCYSTLRIFNEFISSQEDRQNLISVMNLAHFFEWMTTGAFVLRNETAILLWGLKDHFHLSKEWITI